MISYSNCNLTVAFKARNFEIGFMPVSPIFRFCNLVRTRVTPKFSRNQKRQLKEL